jgi:oligopeptidase B
MHQSWRAVTLLLISATLLASSRCMTVSPSSDANRPQHAVESTRPPAPEAREVARRLEMHGHVRTDPWFWLRERENEEVISYLKAENDYTTRSLEHTSGLQSKLYDEIVARIPQSDESVPVFTDGYWCYTRFEPGKEYAIHARKKGTLDAAEDVMVDGNELARGHGYFSLQGLTVSAGNHLLAFATDVVGRRIYTIRFRNLATGEMLPDEIPGTTGNVVWAADDRTVFYSRQHPDTLRWYQIYRHTLGTSPASDVLVYEEKDETFRTYVFRTKSKKYIVIASNQTVSDEIRILRADDPEGEFAMFEPRRRDHEYSIDHIGNTFYIRTNDGAGNFRLMRTDEGATGRESWEEVIPHREDVYIEDFDLFRDFLALVERKDALIHLRIRRWDGAEDHYVEFDEPAYVAALDENPEPDSSTVRFIYSSLTTPWSTYDYDAITHERTLMKREKVGGDFDPASYVTERRWAPARDGRQVPISLVYRNGTQQNGTAPLLLYGYGSYGYASDPAFNAAVISLLDRGFVYAIAHVRGGEELGRMWYEEGRLLRKKNTFTDFIDVTEYLVRNGYGDAKRVFGSGGSAGGLLVGAVMNMRPDLYRGIVARVPFVDVVTTMLDDEIPLTTAEYDEWGDPNDREYYDYMLSYSPYDNVEPNEFPDVLVTTGLHDSQVQYWEPAKWVAKLRRANTADSRILLHTNMEAGHGGASGRFRRHRETALVYAFLLDSAGVR